MQLFYKDKYTERKVAQRAGKVDEKKKAWQKKKIGLQFNYECVCKSELRFQFSCRNHRERERSVARE